MMLKHALLCLLGLVGPVVAQDLFLAKNSSTTQTVNLNTTVGASWWKTLSPAWDNLLCVDLPGGDAYNGHMLWLWECNGQDSQIWVFENYQIRYGLNEDFCIDARDMTDGQQLMLWECNGLPQQTWGWDDAELKIYLSNTAICLDWWRDDYDNGQTLHTWDCNGETTQEWFLSESDRPALNVLLTDCDVAAWHASTHHLPWPTFNTPDELWANAEWANYFNVVYGGIPTFAYPICMGSFTQIAVRGGITTHKNHNCVDTHKKEAVMVTSLFAPECDLSPNLATFIVNPKNTRITVPAYFWAEIQHVGSPGDQLGAGVLMAWYYLTYGSAVWLNVGNTQAFNDHPEASQEFLGTACLDKKEHKTSPHTECEYDFEGWAIEAVNRGLDSIQFIEHFDCQCGETGPSSWTEKGGHDKLCPTEIIHLYGDGKVGCANDYRAGWAAQHTCLCDSTKGYANCAGYGI